MIDYLLEPFSYSYMARAIWVSGAVGTVCAFLSCYLMLKGWSLMGDALAHAIVPGVALAYMLGLPYALGAFFAGILAGLSMSFVRHATALREDAVIGLVFTTFLSIGLLMISIKPAAVDLEAMMLGNILAISDYDITQVVAICAAVLFVLVLKWKDFLAIFFDAGHAVSLGLPVMWLNILFFTLVSAAAVAALQTVGACLVIAMLVTPGATAYLLTDRFGRLVSIAIALGALSGSGGAYLSYFLDANPGGLIVTAQTLIFLAVYIFAPGHGWLQAKLARRGQVQPVEGGAP